MVLVPLALGAVGYFISAALVLAYRLLSSFTPPEPNETVADLDRQFRRRGSMSFAGDDDDDDGNDDDDDGQRTLVGDIDPDRDGSWGHGGGGGGAGAGEGGGGMNGEEKKREKEKGRGGGAAQTKGKNDDGEMNKKGEMDKGKGEKGRQKKTKGKRHWGKAKMGGPCMPTKKQYEDARKKIQYSDELFHFAICGESGSGKSSLVNALRGLADGDNDAAMVKVTEGTKKFARYRHPHRHGPYGNFVWCDFPGAGTQSVPAKGYFNNQGLFLFDFIVLVWDIRFKEHDAEILRNCEFFKIPVFVVRSKTDQHIDNLRKSLDSDTDEGFNRVNFESAKTTVEQQTRQNFQEEIRRCKLGPNGPREVYMVSNRNIRILISLFETRCRGLEGQAGQRDGGLRGGGLRGREARDGGPRRAKHNDRTQTAAHEEESRNEEPQPTPLEDRFERYIIDDRKLLEDIAITAVRRRYGGDLTKCLRMVGEQGFQQGYEAFRSSLKRRP